ncbi:MAG TPA: nuclear transport factor 2 family protein [Trebonia sp.]
MGDHDILLLLADERALGRLTEEYARATDRRELAAAASLFTEDGTLTLFMDGAESRPTGHHQGRAAVEAAIATVTRFDATTHFLGQRTFEVDGDRARGETYCLAYHVRKRHGRQVNVLLAVRYLDTCVRRDGQWLFSERAIIADWTDRSEQGEPPASR